MANEVDHSGQIIEGKYRLIKLLGAGGMGAVYLAEHALIERQVAVKLLHAEMAGHEEIVKRFYREAKAAAAIRHRAIIDVLDMGMTPWGDPFLVMEYLEGEALAEMLERIGPLEMEAAYEIMKPALSALMAAHQKGIIHRDLKPDNIFIAREVDGSTQVKLIDFGISKLTEAGDQTQLTQTGSVYGTPAYMSREQALGASDIDHRTDIYAMGVVLYEMLTGGRPFVGENYASIMAHLLTENPRPPLSVNPDFPPEMEPIVLRALSRDPADRQQSADELERELAAVVKTMGSGDASLLDSDDFRPTMRSESPAPHKGDESLHHSNTIAGESPSSAQTKEMAPSGGRIKLMIGVGAGALVSVGVVLFLTLGKGRKPTAVPEASPEGPAAIAATVASPAAQTVPVLSTDQNEAVTPEPIVDKLTPVERKASKPSSASLSELISRASTAYLKGDVRDARDLYKKATRKSSRSAEAWRGLGMAAAKLGKNAEAKRAYERYLKLRPSAPDAERIRKKLEGL